MDGFGGSGTGARTVRLHRARDVTRGVERQVRADLERAGLRVILGREDHARPTAELVLVGTVDADAIEQTAALAHGGLTRVVAIVAPSGAGDGSGAWRLLDAGAADVLSWGSAGTADAIGDRLRRWRAIDELIATPAVEGTLVGQGPAWVRLLREIVEVARFTDASVLITGESGTGKELVARLIHALDGRAGRGDLIVLDCATVVPTLSGSEFFGHEKGAFTGATSSRDGAFALADGGTLFLDEVGELPAGLQAELLRVIQEGMYKRVGSNTWRRTQFRLVCATNRDLQQERASGRFRSDLYFRIAEWQFRLPSLRERSMDIPLLARTFFRQAHPGGRLLAIDPAVLRFIEEREYPGNVRDLRQLVGRIAKRHVGDGAITIGDVPRSERDDAETIVPASWAVGPGAQTSRIASAGGSTPPATAIRTPWRDAMDAAVRRALEEGATLAEIKRWTADSAFGAALADSPTVLRAAQRLGISERALQLRRAAQRSGAPRPGTPGGTAGTDPGPAATEPRQPRGSPGSSRP